MVGNTTGHRVEEVKDGAGEEAEGSCCEEEDDWPS